MATYSYVDNYAYSIYSVYSYIVSYIRSNLAIRANYFCINHLDKFCRPDSSSICSHAPFRVYSLPLLGQVYSSTELKIDSYLPHACTYSHIISCMPLNACKMSIPLQSYACPFIATCIRNQLECKIGSDRSQAT